MENISEIINDPEQINEIVFGFIEWLSRDYNYIEERNTYCSKYNPQARINERTSKWLFKHYYYKVILRPAL